MSKCIGCPKCQTMSCCGCRHGFAPTDLTGSHHICDERGPCDGAGNLSGGKEMGSPVYDIDAIKAVVDRRKYRWISENLQCEAPCGKLTQVQKSTIIAHLAEGLDRLGFAVDVEYDWIKSSMLIKIVRLSDGTVVATDSLWAA